MSSPFSDNQEPWLFIRSDATVIEELYDDLINGNLHKGVIRKAVRDQEELIMEEQQDIETSVQKTLSQTVSRSSTRGIFESSVFQASLFFAEDDSLRHLLKSTCDGSDLYREAISWAGRVVPWASDLHPFPSDKKSDLFRVAVNASVVPAKIFFAEEEERGEDPHAFDFASVEFELAFQYLSLSLIALKELSNQMQEAKRYLRSGAHLRANLRRAQQRLSQRSSFRSL